MLIRARIFRASRKLNMLSRMKAGLTKTMLTLAKRMLPLNKLNNIINSSNSMITDKNNTTIRDTRIKIRIITNHMDKKLTIKAIKTTTIRTTKITINNMISNTSRKLIKSQWFKTMMISIWLISMGLRRRYRPSSSNTSSSSIHNSPNNNTPSQLNRHIPSRTNT